MTEKKPNKELIRRWVEVLRSGKYEQGYGYLRPDYNKRCCLGVACDVVGSGEWEQFRHKWCFVSLEGGRRYGRRYEYLPRTVRYALFGAESVSAKMDPTITYETAEAFAPAALESLLMRGRLKPGDPVSLSALNDARATFEQIADAIEMEWLS